MEGRDSAPHGTARNGTQRLCDAVRDVRVESRERRERARVGRSARVQCHTQQLELLQRLSLSLRAPFTSALYCTQCSDERREERGGGDEAHNLRWREQQS